MGSTEIYCIWDIYVGYVYAIFEYPYLSMGLMVDKSICN
jgi:hypothetical protein